MSYLSLYITTATVFRSDFQENESIYSDICKPCPGLDINGQTSRINLQRDISDTLVRMQLGRKN